MIKQSEDNKIEKEFIMFLVNCLKEQSPFEAKLKSIQEIKRIIDEQQKLKTIDEKALINYIADEGIVQHMLT